MPHAHDPADIVEKKIDAALTCQTDVHECRDRAMLRTA
jgi:hypothetical protein